MAQAAHDPRRHPETCRRQVFIEVWITAERLPRSELFWGDENH